MKTNSIDPTSFPKGHPLSVALRLTARNWQLAHSKLMSLQWQWSDDVAYGATDGRRLLLSQSGITKLARQKNASGLIAFLLVHEALHALLGHGWRLAKLPNKMLANIAADYVINAMIKMRNQEIGKEVFPFIDGVLLDEQLSGDKSVIELYRFLNKPEPKQEQQDNEKPQQPDQPEDEAGEPEAADTDEDDGASDDGDSGEDAGDSEGDSESDDPAGDTDNGDPAGDSDSPEGEPASGEGEADDLSDFVGTGAPDNIEPEPDTQSGETESGIIDQIEEDNDRILVQDAIDRKQTGNTGSFGRRIASQRAATPSLNWPDLLREWMTSRSRRGWDSPFNPAIYSTTRLACAGRRTRSAGDIVLVIDTSGSVSESTYTRFLQEGQSIMDELKPERLILLSVSHRVADAVILDTGDMVPDRLNGGGGTMFQPAFDWVAENDIDPDVMVYLTDGWSGDLDSIAEPDFPLLWLTTCRRTADFRAGEAIAIDDV